MRHLIRRITGFLLCAIAVWAIAADCTPAFAELGRRSIRVVMDNNYPPFVFPDSNGKLQGVLIDQWALWEKKTGIKAEITGMDWGVALSRMEQGEFDVIDTIFSNEKRAKIFDFTKPYQAIDVPIFFNENISGIRDASSLKGFSVAVKKGDNAVDFLKERGVHRLTEYNSYEEIINAAADNKIDIFVVDKPSALYFLYKKGIHERFNQTRPLYTGAFHRAVRKGNTALLHAVEQGFASISADEYRNIHEKWYGSKGLSFHYLRFIAIGAAFIAALILALIAWNSALRRAVRRKTAELEKEMSVSRDRAEALRESEGLFASFLEYCPILVFLKDHDNRAVAASKSFETLLGTDITNIVGKTSEELFPGDFAKNMRADDEEVLRSGSMKTVEERFNDRTYVTCKFPVLRPDKPPLLAGFTIDITDRKQFEEALKKSEQQYRDVVNNANSIILRWDTTGRILFMNPFGLDLFGYTAEEIIGRNAVGTLVPENEEYTAMVRELVEHPERFHSHDNENLTRGGQKIWVSWANKAVRNDEGRVVEILSIGNDITDRKFLEARFIRAQKMEAVGTLAGGIAHDFNNLLMGIMGYTSMMLLSMETTHPDYERLKSIEQQIRNGAELTKQLLGFARGGKYEVKPTDLNTLLSSNADMFGHTKKEIIIHKKLDEALCVVDVDRSQMEQVFLNLFVNAWQAMPSGGGLYLETRNVEMTGTGIVPRPGTYARVSVTDTGVGMDDRTQERIFDPFFTTKEPGRGSGLGLASVYGIVRNHQGAITVESEPGRGTRFDIYLPASGREIVREDVPVSEPARGSGTILVIEDQPVVAQTARDMLEALGYTVRVAHSGKEGIEILMHHKGEIDLIILDMIMPGLSGSETYDVVRDIDPDVRVILSSGYSIDGQAAAILDKGCNAFIQKPFTVSELSARIRDVLGKP